MKTEKNKKQDSDIDKALAKVGEKDPVKKRGPLPEKDEQKEAEERLRKRQSKQSI